MIPYQINWKLDEADLFLIVVECGGSVLKLITLLNSTKN